MKHLTILVPDGYHNLSSVVGSYEIFTKANIYMQSISKRPIFEIQLASTSKRVRLYNDIFSVKPDLLIADVKKTDLVIIPALRPEFASDIKQVNELVPWITKMYKQGAEIASICTGAFLLASTGLLDNGYCSTHWMAQDIFRKMFPNINLTADKLITDENGIYTNGGAFSFLNLLIYMIEKYYDRQTAIYCSKVFEIDIDRTGQSPFVIFSTQKKHDDELVGEAQIVIENNLHKKVSATFLAKKFNISRRNFDRRFIKATGNTPGEYSQRVKIEAAKKEFESNRKTINEVMYSVGYSDASAFREIFKKVTGMSPTNYRNRYNKEAYSNKVVGIFAGDPDRKRP